MGDGTQIRNALPGDLNYLFSSILRDMRDADGTALPDELWYPAHRAYLENALADPAVEVHVLCAEDDHREILAFVVGRPDQELLWIHVRKGPLREKGLAKRLLTHARLLDAPAAWMTPLGRKRLRNPWRGRQLRRRQSSTAARASSSEWSPPSASRRS